jgi:hypothetical protein
LTNLCIYEAIPTARNTASESSYSTFVIVVMKCILQLLPFIFVVVVVVGLAFFSSVVEAKLGESHSNDRRLKRFEGSVSSRYPLDQCQGDCDVDGHCKGNLICFHRQGYESVPGCQGGNEDKTSTDYCLDPKYIGSENEIILPELKFLGRIPEASHFPLQECEGDCDKNTDCAAGLVCLQRRYENSGPVPGCLGRDNSAADYCVKSSVLYPNGKSQSPPSPPLPPSNLHKPSEPTKTISPPENPHRPSEPTKTISPPENPHGSFEPTKTISPPKTPHRSFEPTKTTSPPENKLEIIEDFGLKMYWEPHYMWQEETFDRRWCMECRNGECDYGDKTYIHTCERAISQRYDFISANDNRRQLWEGDFRRDKFEIKPSGLGSHCVTQRHHPKFYEELEIEHCHLARSSHTSYWTRY